MSLTLEPLDGAYRLRLDEPEWTTVWSAAGAGPGSPVAPLPPAGGLAVPDVPERAAVPVAVPAAVPAATREAVTVATGATALVNLDLAGITRARGLLASLGTDGRSAAGVVRALAVADPGSADGVGDVLVVPGVEVSAFPVERLADEVLRLLPPEGPRSAAHAGAATEPVRVPAPWAMILARAVEEHDEAMLREVAAECGWEDVPELLVSLAGDVRANTTVTLRVAGSDRVGVRRWLLCHLGWVSVDLADGFVTHRLRTREQIRDDLVFDLTGALDAALVGVGPDGG